MDSQSMPANVGSNDELGPAPTQAEIDRLMKRCQVGVGGRRALDDAHDIMAECYGTLGRQQMEIDRLRWALTDVLKVATSWSLFSTTTIDGKPSSTALRLRAADAVLRGPNARLSGRQQP